ncbi:glc operon protein GlcG [Bradyrhizobium sp. GM24.11]
MSNRAIGPLLCGGFLMLAAAAFSVAPSGPAVAQQATPPYGAPISLEQAKKVISAAEAEAQKNNWPMAIVVVDTGGFVVAMHRLDNTQLGSIAVAEDKARTSVFFRRPSKAFEDAVASGGIGLRVLGLRGATPYDGGVPLLVDGKIIGAVGVSGMLPPQDGQVANAGANSMK